MRQARVLSLLVCATIGLLANCSAPPETTTTESSAASTSPHLIATLGLTAYGEQMQALVAQGYDVAGVDLDAKQVDIVTDHDGVAALRAAGFDVVRILNLDEAAQAPDISGYQKPETIATAVRSYGERFPSLAQAKVIGTSVQGRDIWALRITKDVAQPHPPRPAVLYNGMHHARELMTAEVTLDTIDYLLTKYGTDPKVTHWVDVNEIWVVPMLNVDGNAQVWSNDKMWRKNTSGCASGNCPRGSGVDINRNYPYNFAGCRGSSSSPNAEDYHGPSAASEPETKALMNLVEQVRPVFDISYHSYSEVVLYPTGCQGTHAAGGAAAVFADIGKKMGAALPTDNSGRTRTYRAGTPWELLYGVDGDDIDWMYQQYSVNAFGIEVNGTQQGFQPAFGMWRDKTVQKLRTAWQMLLERLDQSGVRGFVHTGGAAIGAGGQVAISAGSAATPQTLPLNPDGSFHVVLMPGEYDVTINAAGHAPATRHVTVGSDRVDLDVSLE